VETARSLSQMPADGIAKGAYAGSISMAVLTTLYGLMLANLVLAPLARLVERTAASEEADRQKIVDWLASHVAKEMRGPESKPLRTASFGRAA
jgi:chemotaxis protein MotA